MIDETSLGSYMGKDLSSDAKAAQVVAAINAWVNNYTGRSFGVNTVITDELQDYKPVIWLDHMDIVSIDELRIGSPYFGGNRQVIPAGNYVINPTGRLMINPSGIEIYSRAYYDTMSIDYTYGVPVVPDDLLLAALGLAADFYNDDGASRGAITMAMVGTYRIQYNGKNNYTSIFESYRARRA